jgi:hypothetical protein
MTISLPHLTIHGSLLTSRPYALRLSTTIFPPSEMSLHESIEIMSRWLNQGGIIVNIVTKLTFFLVRPFPSPHDDTTIWSGIQVINPVFGVAYVVCVGEIGCILAGRNCDVRGSSFRGGDNISILRKKASGVPISREDDGGRSDFSTFRMNSISFVVIRFYGSHGGVCL